MLGNDDFRCKASLASGDKMGERCTCPAIPGTDGYCGRHSKWRTGKPSKPTAEADGNQIAELQDQIPLDVPDRVSQDDVDMGGVTPSKQIPSAAAVEPTATEIMAAINGMTQMFDSRLAGIETIWGAQIKQLKQQLAKEAEEKEKLKTQLAMLKADHSGLSVRVDDQERELRETRKTMVGMEAVIKKLQASVVTADQQVKSVQQTVGELKARPMSYAAAATSGVSGSPTQQRSNGQQGRPPLEQQFIMSGLDGVEGKGPVALASMVKETLGAIGVSVSELHDIFVPKTRHGAAARVKFTVVTAMQARLIRANRKQLREVAAHISIRDVLSPEEQAAQNALWPQFVEARKAGKKAYFQRGQLFIDGSAVEAPASA